MLTVSSSRIRILLACALVIAAVLLFAAPAFASIKYLDALGGQGRALAINDDGVAVGYAGLGFPNAVRWDTRGATRLDAPGPASDINDWGDIVGSTAESYERGWVLSSGQLTVLTTPTGWLNIIPAAINNNGDIVGCGFRDGAMGAFLYRDGVFTDISPVGAVDSRAMDINDAGQVVMTVIFTWEPGWTRWGYLWQQGTLTEVCGADTVAHGINNKGQVVGCHAGRAFIWQAGAFTDIGTLGGTHSDAYAINDRGVVVGESLTSDGTGASHAFLYQRSRMTELGTPAGSATVARDISSSGVAVGFMTVGSPETPVLWDKSQAKRTR